MAFQEHIMRTLDNHVDTIEVSKGLERISKLLQQNENVPQALYNKPNYQRLDPEIYQAEQEELQSKISQNIDNSKIGQGFVKNSAMSYND